MERLPIETIAPPRMDKISEVTYSFAFSLELSPEFPPLWGSSEGFVPFLGLAVVCS